MPVSNLLWAGGFTGSDGHSFRESISEAADGIRLAAALKAGCLVVYSGGRAGHTHNHARRLLVDALRELAPLAEVIAALAAVGYDGDYDVELIGQEIEATDYRELLRHSKTAYEELIGGS